MNPDYFWSELNSSTWKEVHVNDLIKKDMMHVRCA